MAPMTYWADAGSKMFSAPGSWLSTVPGATRIAAGYELMYRVGKDYEKPEFGIHNIDIEGASYPVVEKEIIRKPFCRLLRFKRYTDDAGNLVELKDDPSVLVVAPLSGHHSTLLRDTVRSLLHDHKVFITDWTDARMVPASVGPFHLDDYVAYIQEFIRHIGADNVHVMSVCQPTVPVLAAVSLMAARGEAVPRSMVMMGGPIDTRESPTSVNNLATRQPLSWFENNVIHTVPQPYPGEGRRVYPGFLQHTGFVAMNPDRHATSHYDYFLDLIRGDDDNAEAHRKFYDEYNAVLDMPAEYYLDTIRTVFQEFALVKGTWEVRNPEGKKELVRPQDITTTSLLTIEGELDDISGSGQTRAAQDLCSGIPAKNKKHYDVVGAGHYGIFSGRRWREFAYPEIRSFILAHNKAEAAPQGKALKGIAA